MQRSCTTQSIGQVPAHRRDMAHAAQSWQAVSRSRTPPAMGGETCARNKATLALARWVPQGSQGSPTAMGGALSHQAVQLPRSSMMMAWDPLGSQQPPTEVWAWRQRSLSDSSSTRMGVIDLGDGLEESEVEWFQGGKTLILIPFHLMMSWKQHVIVLGQPEQARRLNGK